MIRVYLVDDHLVLLDGLKSLIDNSGFATVIGAASSGEACLKDLENNHPDVLLLDITLPGINGFEICKTVLTQYPQIHIVAFSGHQEPIVIQEMLQLGAHGYVLKNASHEEILQSIQNVYHGETYLCSQTKLILDENAEVGIRLSTREKQLLRLISDGYTNIEISEKMCLGVETINSYRKDLLYKMGARNTAVLVRKAIQENLI